MGTRPHIITRVGYGVVIVDGGILAWTGKSTLGPTLIVVGALVAFIGQSRRGWRN
jgi:hypothetical protein